MFRRLIRYAVLGVVLVALLAVLPAVNAQSPPTGLSPSGGTGFNTSNITFQWNHTAGNNFYRLIVIRESDGATVHDQWYAVGGGSGLPAINCGATCQILVNRLMGSGNFNWWVGAAATGGGTTAWSDKATFSISGLSAPTGLTTDNPSIGRGYFTYMWNWDNRAEWYHLIVIKQNVGEVHNKWYPATSLSCSGGMCSVKPTDIILANGTYQMWVQAWGPPGFSGWSSANVPLSLPAPNADLFSHSAFDVFSHEPTITNHDTMIYQFADIANASWYNIRVKNQGGSIIFSGWYSREDLAHVLCTAGECQIDPGRPVLFNGNYVFDVGAWGPGGVSINGILDPNNGIGYSTPFSFTVGAPSLAGQTPSLINPKVTTTNTRPTFEWGYLNGATWHQIQLWGGGQWIFNGWIHINGPCAALFSSGNCEWLSSSVLTAGTTYWWQVRSWSSANEMSNWSGWESFTVNP